MSNEHAMSNESTWWVARLAPAPAVSIEAVLEMPLGLDIWERHGNELIVAATTAQLSELERRRLAEVERISTVAEFQVRARRRADSS